MRLPIAGGLLVFGETLPGGALGDIRALAFVFVVVAAALLARPDADAVLPVVPAQAGFAP